MGRRLGPGSGGVVWCYVCVRCESELSVYMAGPGICVLCLADTCASEEHPLFIMPVVVVVCVYFIHFVFLDPSSTSSSCNSSSSVIQDGTPIMM